MEGAQRAAASGRQSLMKLRRGPMLFTMLLSNRVRGEASTAPAGSPSSFVTNPIFHFTSRSLQDKPCRHVRVKHKDPSCIALSVTKCTSIGLNNGVHACGP